MSSISSPESAVSPSGSSEPGCELSASVRSSHTLERSSPNTGLESLSTTMSENLVGRLSEAPMSSAEAFHAKTSAAAELRLESPDSDPAYGSSSEGSFASYDQATQSWRTWQTSLFGGLEMLSGTWPRAGMTRNGTAYQLPSLVCRRPGSAFGLLPTLVGADGQGARNGTSGNRSLSSGLTMTDWLWVNVGRGMLDPGSAEQMMGFPTGWTELSQSETPSRQKSQNSSGEQS